MTLTGAGLVITVGGRDTREGHQGQRANRPGDTEKVSETGRWIQSLTAKCRRVGERLRSVSSGDWGWRGCKGWSTDW